MSQLIYNFGEGTADGGTELKHLLGGKGASLGEMSRLGLPVPPGFTITTAVCMKFFADNGTWVDGLAEDIQTAMTLLENEQGDNLAQPVHHCWFLCDLEPLFRCLE